MHESNAQVVSIMNKYIKVCSKLDNMKKDILFMRDITKHKLNNAKTYDEQKEIILTFKKKIFYYKYYTDFSAKYKYFLNKKKILQQMLNSLSVCNENIGYLNINNDNTKIIAKNPEIIACTDIVPNNCITYDIDKNDKNDKINNTNNTNDINNANDKNDKNDNYEKNIKFNILTSLLMKYNSNENINDEYYETDDNTIIDSDYVTSNEILKNLHTSESESDNITSVNKFFLNKRKNY